MGAGLATLAADTAGDSGDTGMVHRRTVASYVAALERLFVVEDPPAWKPHITSRAQLRGAPKRHLTDPALAVAALASTSEAAMADLRFAGLLFESLVVRDLRIYGRTTGCEPSHYRDSDGLEVAAIVRRPDGRWLAVEVELGGEASITRAVRSLKRLARKVDVDRSGAPSRLVVITAGGFGYEHPDSVSIIPITALGP